MTTTIGFTINWWLVIGIISGILFLMFFVANFSIREDTTSSEFKRSIYDTLIYGRNEIIFFIVSIVCMMKYFNLIVFNF